MNGDVLLKYKGESKVLQYFGNVKHNLAAVNVFNEVVKVVNYTGLSEMLILESILLGLPDHT